MDLNAQAEALPTEAGVYLFKDRQGEVLYVGKARNLRARVRQYLSFQDERMMVRYLVAAARSVEVVPVHSEKEALLLENALIKQHRPRFNVKLRDDKAFLHIRVDPKEAWPRLTTARRARDDGARYFGPYPSATNARRTLAFMQRHFALRTCTDAVLASRKRACLLHQMGRCCAPCVGLVTEAQYAEIVQDATLALAGRNRELLPRLQARMMELAEHERFEDAARVRDLVKSLESSLERQVVADVRAGDRDVWAVHREADRGAAACLPVREGQVLEPRVFPFEGEIGELPELFSNLLNNFYEAGAFLPPEILLPVAPEDQLALEEVLRERRGGRVRLVVPRRGEKVAVLEIAEKAAKTRFLTTHSEEERLARALDGIAEICGLDAPPYRIECFDNSNLLGEDPVASQVVFLDGRPARKEYRRYKVKTVVGADDYATMREILGRRLRRAMEDGDFPDLLVVDGGRGQLGAALDVLRDLGLPEQAVIGVAKPRTERARGDRDAVDKIILPGAADPVILRYDDPSLRLLQHIRDEAHDTAVGFHRDTRSRRAVGSVLDGIPGIGPERRKRLLRHFGSVAALREAGAAAIAEVPGFGPAIAEKIIAALGDGG